MIQLANDPNASRTGWRPSRDEKAAMATQARRVRPGHPWPFLSPQARRPATQEGSTPIIRNDSGS